jgi:hypothetical protein
VWRTLRFRAPWSSVSSRQKTPVELSDKEMSVIFKRAMLGETTAPLVNNIHWTFEIFCRSRPSQNQRGRCYRL